MPTTPDRPAHGAGRSADPLEPQGAAGESHGARETVPIDVRPRTPGDHHDRDNRKTVRIDAGRPGAADDLGNRETVHLPLQRRPPQTRRAPLVVAAAFATLWAALLSYLPVALVMGLARSMEGSAGILGSARVGLAAWLLGHGVPLGTSIGPISLAPLLLTLLAGWRLTRAGVHVTRAVGARNSGSTGSALLVAAAVGIGYGALGALAALAVVTPAMTVSPIRAGLTFTVAGTVAALIGSLRSTGAVVVLARRMPHAVRHGIRTGVVAALLVLAAGAGFTGLSVAIGGGQAAEMIGAYQTGVAGQAGITLVSLAYGANAAVWATSYLLGPGFLLGTGTAVRLTEVAVGPLPTVPLLAGLPEGPVGAAGAGLLAFPVLAGMAAGWMLTRRLVRARQAIDRPNSARAAAGRPGPAPVGPGWPELLGAAALAGPIAGIMLGLLALISGGALGAGRLAQIGPVPWQTAVTCAAVVTVSSLIGAAVSRGFRVHNRP
jgi:hypothetical protein